MAKQLSNTEAVSYWRNNAIFARYYCASGVLSRIDLHTERWRCSQWTVTSNYSWTLPEAVALCYNYRICFGVDCSPRWRNAWIKWCIAPLTRPVSRIGQEIRRYSLNRPHVDLVEIKRLDNFRCDLKRLFALCSSEFWVTFVLLIGVVCCYICKTMAIALSIIHEMLLFSYLMLFNNWYNCNRLTNLSKTSQKVTEL